ncbi:hypothetical protein [Aggregatibacter actinomycetemcomitans]|uniref:hypothetical protein n=1 Tax=Aggregatibacter actinomycetemcomitans TaxID=714 RepID=UPI0021512B05|nr:hypothetical protein [Aggregatibacter actinomycetemcomitans]
MNYVPMFICRLLAKEPISPWKELLDNLKNNPNDWDFGWSKCSIKNKHNRVGFWIYNGSLWFEMVPGGFKIPVTQRYWIYKAVNELHAAKFKSISS